MSKKSLWMFTLTASVLFLLSLDEVIREKTMLSYFSSLTLLLAILCGLYIQRKGNKHFFRGKSSRQLYSCILSLMLRLTLVRERLGHPLQLEYGKNRGPLNYSQYRLLKLGHLFCLCLRFPYRFRHLLISLSFFIHPSYFHQKEKKKKNFIRLKNCCSTACCLHYLKVQNNLILGGIYD